MYLACLIIKVFNNTLTKDIVSLNNWAQFFLSVDMSKTYCMSANTVDLKRLCGSTLFAQACLPKYFMVNFDTFK